MKKIRVYLLLIYFVAAGSVQAQRNPMISSNEVHYMVTHDPATGLFTAWVVPNYTTPNANNPESEDWGATAQFSLKVPRDFTLSNLRDIRGSWDKAAYKLTTPAEFAQTGADANWAYYIIGKSPQETNYGPFKAGEPVALFTFKGTGGAPEQVSVLDVTDPFSEFADQQMALNIRSSFYSRSGQRAMASAMPLEQLSGITTVNKVLKAKQEQMGLLGITEDSMDELSLMVYPNPASDVVNITYFNLSDQPDVQLDILDTNNMIRQNKALQGKAGLNTVQLNVAGLTGGMYIVRTRFQNRQLSKKLVKQ